MNFPIIEKIKLFLNDIRIESKKVTWPARKELMASTLIVILTVLIITAFIALADFIFGKLITFILR
jgi:preprotein translocase subunit SecE